MSGEQQGVVVVQTEMEVNGTFMEGWAAEFDGTTVTAISREEALRKLVKAVGQEAL